MTRTHTALLATATALLGWASVGCERSKKQDISSPELTRVERRRQTMEKRKPSASQSSALLAGRVGAEYSPKYAIQNIEMLDEEHAQAALTFAADTGLRPVFAKLQWVNGKWEFMNFSHSEEHDSGLTPIGATGQ